MIIEQKHYTRTNGWKIIRTPVTKGRSFHLVLAFAGKNLIKEATLYAEIKAMYPSAEIVIASTSGEICDTEITDESVSLVALGFEKTTIQTARVLIDSDGDSYEAAHRLAAAFPMSGLSNVLLFSDGQFVNGSALVRGLQEFFPADTIITGGLAGDGDRFQATLVGLNEEPGEGRIVAIGFYGRSFSVSYGSVVGCSSFGPERLITRSNGNILYELDGRPALDIYRHYLGEYAADLPGSAFLFPLSLRIDATDDILVRTILNINEDEKSLVFAGDMPQGAYTRLMKAGFNRLIDGAMTAAKNSMESLLVPPQLALLISCVGRRIVLEHRTEEELEVIRGVYGPDTVITGFYSYGEIAPLYSLRRSELHNHTMTITTLSELI